jgi:hypothetical protein
MFITVSWAYDHSRYGIRDGQNDLAAREEVEKQIRHLSLGDLSEGAIWWKFPTILQVS